MKHLDPECFGNGEVVLISQDQVAVHWVDEKSSHIAKFERLNVDEFLFGKGEQNFGGIKGYGSIWRIGGDVSESTYE